jgi:thioredoxin-like negative regulator of GroEL
MKAAVQSYSIEPINNLNFEAQVLRSPQPVLLLCMNNQEMLSEQIEVLQQHIENNHSSDIRVCLLEEECIYAFKQMYDIAGLPIFLLFVRGKEIGRMLGMADPGHLHAFLAQYFPEAEDISGEEFVWG